MVRLRRIWEEHHARNLVPRNFWELLADSLVLAKESGPRWAAIIAAGLTPGVAASAAAFWVLDLRDMEALKSAIASNQPAIVLPLLAAGVTDKICGLLAVLAVMRSVSSVEEGKPIGISQAYGQALSCLGAFFAAQALALFWILWGLARLIWPGLKACVLYSFVPAAVLTDGARGAEALARSAKAAGAAPAKTAGNLAAASLLAGAAAAAASVALTATLKLPGTVVAGQESIAEALLQGFLNEFLGGLALGWLAAFSILLYRDLSQAEGPKAA